MRRRPGQRRRGWGGQKRRVIDATGEPTERTVFRDRIAVGRRRRPTGKAPRGGRRRHVGTRRVVVGRAVVDAGSVAVGISVTGWWSDRAPRVGRNSRPSSRGAGHGRGLPRMGVRFVVGHRLGPGHANPSWSRQVGCRSRINSAMPWASRAARKISRLSFRNNSK